MIRTPYTDVPAKPHRHPLARVADLNRRTVAHLSQITAVFGWEAAITFDDFPRAERLIVGYVDTTLALIGDAQ